MNKWFYLILIPLISWSCESDSDDFITLPSNPATKALIPDFSGGQYFQSNTGDTIRLWAISSSSSYSRIEDPVQLATGSASLDYVEVENINRTVGNDTLGFRFGFNLQTSYEPESVTLSKDKLSVDFKDQLQSTAAIISITYIDTLACTSNYCNYSDTLQFYNQQFLEVFHTSNPTTNYTLYLNSTYGLIGFRDSSNTIYELIP